MAIMIKNINLRAERMLADKIAKIIEHKAS